jgi:acetate kinase
VDARARRRPPGDPGLDLALLSRILVVNAGSTSLKLSLVDEDGGSVAVDGFEAADAVGHRVVHGGARFRDPVRIDEEVVDAIRDLSALAPLHNRPALAAIEEARTALPDVRHVAVFDTAFHATIPERAATYAIPSRWREEWGVRRYGFHGLAVESVAEQVRVPRLVVCHLGGGCSVTAVLDGRSVDTTMGFSPLEGVPMATRSGSVDPGALLYLLRERGLSVDALDACLEHESGLEALGGLDESLGFAVYTYRIGQAAAAMAVAVGGVDALAFSGGVGENRADVRDAIAGLLRFLGEVRVEVAPAREDVVVARAVRRLLANP